MMRRAMVVQKTAPNRDVPRNRIDDTRELACLICLGPLHNETQTGAEEVGCQKEQL